MKPKDYILGSQSKHRLNLLETIGYLPKEVCGADIDETPFDKEKPTEYVKRMAKEKALKVAGLHKGEVVLASDTIIVVGRRIIQKASSPEEQAKVMHLLSGTANKVLTAICVVDRNGKAMVRVSETKVYLKRLSSKEIQEYVDCQEWVGCAGYAIEGKLQGYVKKIVGSYSSVVGIDLYVTKQLLDGVL